MAELEFKNLKEAAAYAEKQDKRIEELLSMAKENQKLISRFAEKTEKSEEDFLKHAELLEGQIKLLSTIEEDLQALKNDSDQEETSKNESQNVRFKLGKDEYEIRKDVRISLPGRGSVSGAEIAKDKGLAEKLVKAKLKSIKKV